jgi:hypothetical protein
MSQSFMLPAVVASPGNPLHNAGWPAATPKRDAVY